MKSSISICPAQLLTPASLIHIDLTILAGDVYQNDPDWLQAKAEDLNLEVARKQAEELEDYKQQLEEDPEAYQEMLEAAALYAKDNDIPEAQQQPESTVQLVYSYPYWYPYSYWAPMPYYYHTGFYIGPGGVVIIVSLPSYHYVHWHYTYYPHRHVHLHAHYHRHHHRHPHGHGGFHATVNVNIKKDIQIRNNRKPDRQKGRQTMNAKDKPNLKLDNRNSDNRNFDRFRASENHRGNWNNRGGTGSGKMAGRRRN